jgi:O-antigen ligase
MSDHATSRPRSRRRSENAATDEDENASSRKLRPLEFITLAHVGTLVLLATWYFGGGSAGARLAICIWGSLGLPIMAAAVMANSRRRDSWRPLRWLWPVVGFNVLVLLSCLNPSFSEKFFEGDSLLANTGAAKPDLPSTAHPVTSLRHLWLFDVLYISCFNLVLAVRHRRALRGLLFFACANGVLLAVFGTLQKLTADGLFFGAVKSPNPRFFATFIYGNHWAAYVVLLIGAAGGLIFRFTRRNDGNPRTQALLTWSIAGLLLMAVTPVIAGSRAGTLMVFSLLLVYGIRALWRIWRKQRSLGQLALAPLLGLAACAIITVFGSIWLGREAMEDRWNDTRAQFKGDILHGRRGLYYDTWRLVDDEPVFGWGLGTYSQVFQLIRPRPLEPNRQYERSYADAHSDWLQALAEVGYVGTALLALTGIMPLLRLRTRHFRSPVTTFTLLGCAFVVLYAIVEFPFGNPAVVLTWWLCLFCALQSARLRDLRTVASSPDAPAETELA